MFSIIVVVLFAIRHIHPVWPTPPFVQNIVKEFLWCRFATRSSCVN